MKRGLDISTFTNGLLMYYVITRITRPNWILQDSYDYKYSKKVLFILPNKQKTQRSTLGKHLFHWFWQVKVEQIHKLLWQMSQFVLQVYLHIENVIPSVLEMYYIKKSTTFLLVVFLPPFIDSLWPSSHVKPFKDHFTRL